MKKIFLLLTTIALTIIVILSCNKNHEDPVTMNKPAQQSSLTGQSMEQRILAFKSEIESHLKTGSTYPIDTAVRYTEALVNYTYADVANNLEGLSVDSVYITVPLTNGQVSTLQTSYVYDKIIDSLTVQYENLPSQNLHLVFADVFSKDSTSGSVKFGVISAFSYGDPLYYGPFGEYDWWWFGFGRQNSGGYCDGPYEGTHTNDDAAMQIERRIRLNIGVPAQRHSPADVVTLDIWPDGLVHYYGDPLHDIPPQNFNCNFLNENDEQVEDNYYDYLCYINYYSLPNFHGCLSPDEMNFYWAGEDSVCTDLIYNCDQDLSEILEGKTFMSIINEGSIYGEFQNYKYVHIMTNTYGVWIVNPNEPETFD